MKTCGIRILPLVHLKSICFGSFMVSLPYFNYGGYARNAGGERGPLKAAIGIGTEKKVKHIELRHAIDLDLGPPVNRLRSRCYCPALLKSPLGLFSIQIASQIKA